jgi:hypothetical protein
MSILSRLEKLEEATKPIREKELRKQKKMYDDERFLKNASYMILKYYPEHEWNTLDYDKKVYYAFEDKNLNIYYEVLELMDEYFRWLKKHSHHPEDEQDKLWNEYKPDAYKNVKSRLKESAVSFKLPDDYRPPE